MMFVCKYICICSFFYEWKKKTSCYYLLQRKEKTRLFDRRGATAGAEERLSDDSDNRRVESLFSSSIEGIFRLHDCLALSGEVGVWGELGRISSDGGLTSAEYRKGLGGYCRTVAVAENPNWGWSLLLPPPPPPVLILGMASLAMFGINICWRCCSCSSLSLSASLPPVNILPRLLTFFGLAKNLDVFFLRFVWWTTYMGINKEKEVVTMFSWPFDSYIWLHLYPFISNIRFFFIHLLFALASFFYSRIGTSNRIKREKKKSKEAEARVSIDRN